MIERPRQFLIKSISFAAIMIWLLSLPILPVYGQESTSVHYTTENQEETVEEVVEGANEIITEGAGDIVESAAIYSDALHGDCPASGTVLLAHINKCWSCTLFDTIFRSINTLATSVYNKISYGCIELLTVFLGIWLIIQVGRYIGSLAEQNPVEFFEGIISILCKAMIAGAILVQPVSLVTDLLISPLVVGTTEISIAITQGFTGSEKIRPNEDQISNLNRDYIVERQQIEERYDLKKKEVYIRYGCSSECSGLAKTPLQQKRCEECKANPPREDCGSSPNCFAAIYNLDKQKENEYKALEQDQSDAIIGLYGVSMLPYYCVLMESSPGVEEKVALNSQLYNALMCMINNLHNTTAYGQAMASSILCHAWTAEQSGILPIQFPSLKMLFTGVVIWLVCFLLSLLFVFKLIDVCFRLGILLVLLPLLIVAWVFPPTVEFTKKGFQLLLHVMMVFISMAIVLSLAIALVEIAFGGNSESISGSTIIKDAASLQDYFNTNQVFKMNDAIQFSLFNFIIAGLCCIFAIKILSLIDQLATEFSSVVGVGSDIGDRLGMVSSRVTAVVAQATATLAITETQSGINRISNLRATRKHLESFGAAPKQQYTGRGSRNTGSSVKVLPRDIDEKALIYAGLSSSNFEILEKDISLARRAMNIEGKYSKGEVLQAKLALRANSNARKIYDGGEGVLRGSEQAYNNAKILRTIYGASTLEKMSSIEREGLIYKGELYGLTSKTSSERIDQMMALDDESFYRLKKDIELADKVRQGRVSLGEEQRVYDMVQRGDDNIKLSLTMSESQFSNYKEALKVSEESRKKP